MSDSVLNGAIEPADLDVPITEPKLRFSKGSDPLRGQGDYFRHKGIKIKFKDIEDAIVEYPYISKVAILFSENNEGNRRLVAYIIPHGTFNQKDITSFLADKLEPFMIPASWVCMKEFPLTPSGNIDKLALQEPQPAELTANEFIAPGTDKELKLAIIIKKILNLESVSITDNFLSLGGSSLKALALMASLRKELSININLKYFFIYPNIAELAAYLDNIDTIKDGSNSDKVNDKPDSKSIFHHTSVVPIKKGGKKMPLYIVCGAGSNVLKFETFVSMLDTDRPVYGLQQPLGISEMEHFPDTIEGIAERYVHEILKINPDGPYALSGHSVGGVIALEMARSLQSIGKKIYLLIIFDVILTKDPESHKPSIRNVFNFKANIKKVRKKISDKVEFEIFLLTKYPKYMLAYRKKKLMGALKKVLPVKKGDTDFMDFITSKKFEKKFVDAYAKYKVNRFSGNVIVCYAKDRYKFLDKEKSIVYKKYSLPEEVKNLWKKHADDVKIFEVDGEHNTMFEPNNSKALAGILQQHLEMYA